MRYERHDMEPRVAADIAAQNRSGLSGAEVYHELDLDYSSIAEAEDRRARKRDEKRRRRGAGLRKEKEKVGFHLGRILSMADVELGRYGFIIRREFDDDDAESESLIVSDDEGEYLQLTGTGRLQNFNSGCAGLDLSFLIDSYSSQREFDERIVRELVASAKLSRIRSEGGIEND